MDGAEAEGRHGGGKEERKGRSGRRAGFMSEFKKRDREVLIA